jgi:hypothetical protein
MSTKKIKGDLQVENDVQVDNVLKLPANTAERVLTVDASGNVASSTVTETELGYLSGATSDVQTQLNAKIPSSEKGAANGVATLDAGSKIPSSQLPAIAITDVFTVADIAARDALTVGTGDGQIQEGDVVIVTDASADANITAGAASYIYDGAAYALLKAGDEVLSVNGNTGTVVLDTDDVLEGATNKYFSNEAAQDAVGTILTDSASVDFTYDDGANTITAAVLPAGVDHDSLSNFVANEHVDHSAVDITTAADSGLSGGGNITASRSLAVDIAGTTAETSVADDDEILIYDTSAGALRSMTKANFVGDPGSSAGDISETSFSMANNVTVAANVTSLAFANGTVRSFEALVSVQIDATADLFEVFKLHGIQKGASWDMSVESTGDNSQVVFTITAAGQVQYTSGNVAGFVSGTMKFRAITLTV